MSPLLKNLVIALGITIFVGVGYYFLSGSTVDTPLAQETPSEGLAALASQTAQLLEDTQRVNNIGLEQKLGLFDDKRFTSLIDTRINLIDVGTGRPNPFAPVE